MNAIVTVADVIIRQDLHGRYCLNDLHKAAGGENKNRPSLWVENKQTQEIIEELSKAGIPALVSQHGGSNPGTYVCKELVYAYAMWISPSFHVKVIRAYDALVSTPQPQPTFSLPNPNFEAAEFMCRMLNLHGSQKLSVVRRAVSLSAPDMLAELPAYSIDAPRTMDGTLVCAEAGSRPSSSATALLKARNSKVSAQAFNKVAYEHGFIDDGERPSSENPKVIRKYKKVSDKGLKYGMNLTHEKAKGSPQPYWFEDSFDELLELLDLK